MREVLRRFHLGWLAAIWSVSLVVIASSVSADTFTGGSYKIDASVIGNSFGGSSSGGSYKLTDSGGESIIGQGSGGSYRLDSGYIAQLQSSLRLDVQPGNLAAYYNLDETNGSRLADGGASALAASAANGPVPGTGKVGGGWVFDGTDDKLSPGDPAALQTLTELTWSAWVNSSNITKEQMILSKQGANYLRIVNSKPFASLRDNSVQKTITGVTTMNNDQWYHVAATLKAGEMALYLNGVKEANRTDVTGPLSFNTGTLEIGQWTDVDRRAFQGTIDEVKLFGRALSANEIKAEYDAGMAGTTAGLSFVTRITPGVSQTSPYDAIVLTDAPNGYTLAVSQNQNLTKDSDTIAPVSGSIASPVAWTEGTTKGLGFTLFGTNATALPAKWSAGASYAAFPASATSYYVRTGKQSGKDVINMRLRLDVPSAQPGGVYTNVMTTTGTITP